MNIKLQNPFILICTLALVFLTVPAEARIKCWTNKDGVKECGDKVPPEYAQKGHKELSERGFVVEETERAKTEEELAEEAKQAELEAEKARVEEEKKKHDMILLQTFSTVEDIERSRDEKLTAINTTIGLTEKRTEKIQADLDGRVKQAAANERAGKEPSDDLLKDIENLRKQIDDNNNYIADKKVEQEKVKEDYGKDIARFKELKSAGN